LSPADEQKSINDMFKDAPPADVTPAPPEAPATSPDAGDRALEKGDAGRPGR
jgi:hypothetical protein